jgi:DNA-directed RNA polymerase subunit M/transcription elongation factor TFIIS
MKNQENPSKKKPALKRVELEIEEEETEFGDIKCPKCGQKKVDSWTQQTRASDEPPTTFYKCRNCHYSWREYG